LTPADIQKKAEEILSWAKEKGATHYTFLAYPHTSTISEKHESFIDVKYIFEGSNIKPIVRHRLTGEMLVKGEGDGSSFPSGGLRATHQARGYTIWDPQSHPYIRKRNNLLYIPSFLVSHHGDALDDKTLFRASEKLLKNNCLELLKKLGIKAKSVVMTLGLEQEFFVVPKKAFNQRLDLRNLGRALVGVLPAKNQQFGDHYYGKLPQKII
jgi:glutamine synthetase